MSRPPNRYSRSKRSPETLNHLPGFYRTAFYNLPPVEHA